MGKKKSAPSRGAKAAKKTKGRKPARARKPKGCAECSSLTPIQRIARVYPFDYHLSVPDKVTLYALGDMTMGQLFTWKVSEILRAMKKRIPEAIKKVGQPPQKAVDIMDAIDNLIAVTKPGATYAAVLSTRPVDFDTAFGKGFSKRSLALLFRGLILPYLGLPKNDAILQKIILQLFNGGFFFGPFPDVIRNATYFDLFTNNQLSFTWEEWRAIRVARNTGVLWPYHGIVVDTAIGPTMPPRKPSTMDGKGFISIPQPGGGYICRETNESSNYCEESKGLPVAISSIAFQAGVGYDPGGQLGPEDGPAGAGQPAPPGSPDPDGGPGGGGPGGGPGPDPTNPGGPDD